MRLLKLSSWFKTSLRQNVHINRSYSSTSRYNFDFEKDDVNDTGVYDYTDPPINPQEKEMLSKENVLILGSDVESLLAAISMSSRGVTPTLVSSLENEKKARNPNAFFMIPLDTIYALNRFPNLVQSIADYSIIIDHFSLYDHKGEHWGSFDYKHFKMNSKIAIKNYNTMSIQYDTLLRILTRHVNQLKRIKKDYDNTVTKISQSTQNIARQVKVNVIFEKNSTLDTVYDHVLIAEGCRSKTRSLVWKSSEILVSKQCILKRYSILIKRPLGIPNNRYIEMWGDEKIICISPAIGGKAFVYAYSKADQNIDPLVENVKESPVDIWIKEFNEFGGFWLSMIDEIQKIGIMTIDYIFDFRLQSFPYYNKVGLIGGAARSMLPFVNFHENSNLLFEAISAGDLICRKDLDARHYLTTLHFLREAKHKTLQEQSLTSALYMFSMATTSWRKQMKTYFIKLSQSSKKLLAKESKLMAPAPLQLSDLEKNNLSRDMSGTLPGGGMPPYTNRS